MSPLYFIPMVALAFIALYIIFGSFFTVTTAEVAIITRFGKFLRIAEPGLNWKSPFFDSVAGMVSLRVNQITLTMEDQDQRQRVRHNSHFRPESGSPGESLRCLLQAGRSRCAD